MEEEVKDAYQVSLDRKLAYLIQSFAIYCKVFTSQHSIILPSLFTSKQLGYRRMYVKPSLERMNIYYFPLGFEVYSYMGRPIFYTICEKYGKTLLITVAT